MLGYPGALWFAGDSYVYLGAALRPQPNLSKSTGYSLFLRLLLPFHSLTLVTAVQHLMGLAVAVLIYVLLRRNRVSKTWSAIATLPVLLDGYIIEDEHLIMAETVFTFCLMVALAAAAMAPGPGRWWVAVIAGLLVGYAVTSAPRARSCSAYSRCSCCCAARRGGRCAAGWSRSSFAVVSLVPVAGYAAWFHQRTGHYNTTMSAGFYLWGRVSSFADCARIKPTGLEVEVCPTEPLASRTPPGNFVWHAPQVHVVTVNGVLQGSQYMWDIGGPVTAANNTLLTNFAIHAVEAQPLDYLKTVFFNTMLSFGFPRIAYPGAGTMFFYNFHVHYVTSTYNTLPPNLLTTSGFPAAPPTRTGSSYGHQAPGVGHRVFALPILAYQRVVFTYGPLLALIFLIGLGGVIRRAGAPRLVAADCARSVRLKLGPQRRAAPRMLPWVTAVALLVFPDRDRRLRLPLPAARHPVRLRRGGPGLRAARQAQGPGPARTRSEPGARPGDRLGRHQRGADLQLNLRVRRQRNIPRVPLEHPPVVKHGDVPMRGPGRGWP